MADILWTVLAGLIILFGLVSVFVPVLPDMFIIWLAALGYGLLVGWGDKGPWLFAAITLLAILGQAAELWSSGVGTKMGGGSVWGLIGGLGLASIGMIFLGPLGGLAGLILAPVLIEYYRQRDWNKAFKAAFGLGVGYGASFGVKLLTGMLMAVVWIAWVLVE